MNFIKFELRIEKKNSFAINSVPTFTNNSWTTVIPLWQEYQNAIVFLEIPRLLGKPMSNVFLPAYSSRWWCTYWACTAPGVNAFSSRMSIRTSFRRSNNLLILIQWNFPITDTFETWKNVRYREVCIRYRERK